MRAPTSPAAKAHRDRGSADTGVTSWILHVRSQDFSKGKSTKWKKKNKDL